MPTARARQLCPQAVFVDGHYSRYAQVSEQLKALLVSTTPLVEPIGLDEAFLDVTGARRLLGSAERIARALRTRVRSELNMDCSIGVGQSKLIAKLASRAAKPKATKNGKEPGPGVLVVRPEHELSFLHPLPVEALWGVGPATAKRLHELGLQSVGDLAALSEDLLVRRFGKAQGAHLSNLARGQDPSPVVADRPAKSIGHEETFARDITDRKELQAHALRMAHSVADSLRAASLAARTITVKIKFEDFSLLTRSHTLPVAIDTAPALSALASALIEVLDLPLGVRLLGISASGLQESKGSAQLTFDLSSGGAARGQVGAADADQVQASWQDVTAAIDAIRERFGRTSVGTAAMVAEGEMRIPGRREAPWGPTAERDVPEED
jgi:DNA polymerase-4